MWFPETPESRRGYEYQRGAYRMQGEAMLWGCLVVLFVPAFLAALACCVFAWLVLPQWASP